MNAVAASLFPDLDGHWFSVKDTDPRLYALYRRHYSTQHLTDTPGRRAFRSAGPAPSIAPFGDYIALLTPDAQAGWLWVRAPDGIWQSGAHGVSCAFFRNEGTVLSSDLIQEACEIAWARWPGERLFTFVEDAKVATSQQKGRATAGWCYRKAGWKVAGRNKDGRLTILEIFPTAEVRTDDRRSPRKRGDATAERPDMAVPSAPVPPANRCQAGGRGTTA